jgi:hypothetical protein
MQKKKALTPFFIIISLSFHLKIACDFTLKTVEISILLPFI